MIINGKALLAAAPIMDMADKKINFNGLSYGLSEVGYDIRLKERVEFIPARLYQEDDDYFRQVGVTIVSDMQGYSKMSPGRTALGSSVETFRIPENLWGELRNKSSNARRFIDAALGTDMEPGWRGTLTIEIVFNGEQHIVLEAGTPILKAVFHEIAEPTEYTGKYQDQPDHPVPAIINKDP